MLSKIGKGYCIVCAEVIPQNINNTFCNKCLSLHNFPIKQGLYCHICRCEGQFSYIYPFCMECKGLCREGLDIESDIYKNWLTKYRSISISKLKPLWACYSNFDKCIQPPQKEYIVHNTNIIALIDETNLEKYFNLNNILNGDAKSNSRILNILERWNRKLYIDPPIIMRNNNFYQFRNGRHRTIAAYYLKVKTIPIFIEKY